MKYDNCPVCRSSRISYEFEARDETVSGEMFKIYTCQDCTLRFTNPVPDEGNIGKYYKSEDYVSHSDTSRGLINFLYQKVRSITLKGKRKLLRKESIGGTGNLLDVGAGTGAFLKEMKDSGWDTMGLEPDEDARSVARNKHDLNLQRPDTLFTISEGSYDAITMWHVLEHVHKLHEYLATFNKILKEKGVLFIAVPNYTSLDARIYKNGWAAYDVPRHLYHFSPESMNILVQKHGLRIRRMKSMPFDSFYVCMLSEKYRGGNIIRAFWNGMRSWINALGHPSRCSSVIYIIEKSGRDV